MIFKLHSNVFKLSKCFLSCFCLLFVSNYHIILLPHYMGLFLGSQAISSRCFQLLNKLLFYVGSGQHLLCCLHFMLFLMRAKLTLGYLRHIYWFSDLQKLMTPLESLISACSLHLRRNIGLCWPTTAPSFAISCSPTSWTGASLPTGWRPTQSILEIWFIPPSIGTGGCTPCCSPWLDLSPNPWWVNAWNYFVRLHFFKSL